MKLDWEDVESMEVGPRVICPPQKSALYRVPPGWGRGAGAELRTNDKPVQRGEQTWHLTNLPGRRGGKGRGGPIAEKEGVWPLAIVAGKGAWHLTFQASQSG
jgi:hypothetical protein